MTIRITNKMKEKFKIALTEDNEKDVERFDSWHANIFTFQRKTGIIIMNDLTRYSVILFGIQKSDMNQLSLLIKEQLVKNMTADGFDDLSIQKVVRSFKNIRFAKTNDRSVLGQIKDSLYSLSIYLDFEEVFTGETIQDANYRCNKTPMGALEKDDFEPFPVLALRKVLIER